jgi:hypothetical protein
MFHKVTQSRCALVLFAVLSIRLKDYNFQRLLVHQRVLSVRNNQAIVDHANLSSNQL